MYAPGPFAESRPSVLQEAIFAARIGDLVSSGAEGLEATTLPLLWTPGGPHGRLIGHAAKANGHWRRLDESPVLAIFHVTDSYISPSFYPSKLVDGKVVPTWNYVIVQAHGIARIRHDATWKEDVVRQLTERHESGREEPWAVDDAPRDYIDKMLSNIVGIEIGITRIEGKWKLGQNRSKADVDGIIANLAAGSPSDQRTAEMTEFWRREPTKK